MAKKRNMPAIQNCDAVIVSFELATNVQPKTILAEIYHLEDVLDDILGAGGLGDCDGHEIGDSEVQLYMYGSSAGEILAAIKPTLESMVQRPIKILLRTAAKHGTPEQTETTFIL